MWPFIPQKWQIGTKTLPFRFCLELLTDLPIAIDFFTVDLLFFAKDFTTGLLTETLVESSSKLDLTKTILVVDDSTL